MVKGRHSKKVAHVVNNMAMEAFLSSFNALLPSPGSYINPSSEQRANTRNALKLMFDFYQRFASEKLVALETRPGGRHIDTGPLSELYMEGLDDDQIWEQIELVNKPVLKALRGVVGKLSDRLDSGEFQLLAMPSASANSSSISRRHGGSSGSQELAEEKEEVAQDSGEQDFVSGSDEDLEAEDLEAEEEGGGGGRGKMKAKGRSSVVDDRFFKLSEMQRFLEVVEKEVEDKGN